MKIEEISAFPIASIDPLRGEIFSAQNVLEKLMISLIAFLGIIGSIYIIATSSMADQPAPIENLVYFSPTLLNMDKSEESITRNKLDKYIEMSGSMKSGSTISFRFVGEKEEGYRYMLEMGDKMRVMFRSDFYRHVYETPGTYELELKKTKNAIVTTIAKKTITIE